MGNLGRHHCVTIDTKRRPIISAAFKNIIISCYDNNDFVILRLNCQHGSIVQRLRHSCTWPNSGATG